MLRCAAKTQSTLPTQAFFINIKNVLMFEENLSKQDTTHLININHLTDSTTLTIMYMAVSMVINILTTFPLVSLIILNGLLASRLLSSVLLEER